MPYPLTPTIGLPLVPDGDQAWGQAMRDALTALDGIASIERQVAATTPTLGFYETTTLEVNLSQAADLTVLTTDHPAWVRIYGSAAARTEDASRNINTKVTDGRGCFGDAITYLPDGLTLTWSEVPTFQNLDTPRTGKAYLAVTSMDPTYSGPINLTFTYRERGPRTGAIQGLAGLDGHTILTMARDPVAADGKDGDIAINTVTWKVFAPKAAGAWPAGVSLVGPQGAPGTPGTNGTNGTNGLDGKTVRYGAANPLATDGTDGDFWINTTTHFIFGPKASGAWPAGTSLVGPAGTNGLGVPAGGLLGQVLAKASSADNDTLWTTPSSGGSGSVIGMNPAEVKPVTPNAWDDEFAGTSLDPAWQIVNSSAMTTLEVVTDHVHIIANNPDATCAGIVKPITGDFTLTMSVRILADASTAYHALGWMFKNSANGKIFTMWVTPYYTNTTYWNIFSAPTTRTSYGSVGTAYGALNATGAGSAYAAPIYIKAVRSGASVSIYFSSTGWWWALMYTLNITSTLGEIDLAGIGLMKGTTSGNNPHFLVNWIRRT
jgi:hypothetical protein